MMHQGTSLELKSEKWSKKMPTFPVQTVNIIQNKMIGETFDDELKAGAPALYYRVNAATPPFLSKEFYAPTLTDAELTKLNQLITAHDSTKVKPKFLPIELIRARAEAEIVNGGASAWDKLIDWVLVTPALQARRDTFTRFMWKGNPVAQTSTTVRDWFAAAGVPAAAIERIMALPPVE